MPGLKRKWRRRIVDRALNYLALARKARLVELGEEPVGAAARAQKACLVVVAKDASDHSWRRAKSFVAGTNQQCLRLAYTKDELGMAVGRQDLAMAAFTDSGLALKFVEALGQNEKNKAVIEDLQDRTRRVQKHRQEEKAHRRNVRMGRTQRDGGSKK